MSEMHASVYLTSRAASAVINAAAVAVFTRITSPDLYGQYLIGFAICFVVYGLGVQWAAYSHFGNYSQGRADRLAGSLLVISGLSMLPALAIIAGLAGTGVLHADVAWASAVLLVCLTVYFVAVEIGRTHLLVAMVTVATLTRSVGSLAFGVLALLLFKSPAALLIGVGLGYALGAVPVFWRLSRSIWSAGFVWPARQDLAQMLRYGWPLMIAFGASAAAMNIDRIMLERMQDVVAVAPYGAVLDFMKQTFLVVAEAISIGYVSYAKTLHSRGDGPGANGLLKRAFVTQCYLIVFGTVFFVLLGEATFSILLPASYLPVAMQILPILLVANALLVLRAYHFGQVIYLSSSSKLEFVSSVVMLIVAIVASLVLIPPFGAIGAASAFALSQGAALLVYLVATPSELRLPLDWPRAAVLAVAGAGLILVGEVLQAVLGQAVANVIDLVLLTLTCAYFLFRWNLFDARVIAERAQAKISGHFSGA